MKKEENAYLEALELGLFDTKKVVKQLSPRRSHSKGKNHLTLTLSVVNWILNERLQRYI